jgi:hypothetical protein
MLDVATTFVMFQVLPSDFVPFHGISNAHLIFKPFQKFKLHLNGECIERSHASVGK